MARSEELYLRDILQCIELIALYVDGRRFDEFLADDMFRDAVTRRLEIIGEAASHLGKPLRERYPDVEWGDVVAFRNFVIHAYFAIDSMIVWNAATRNAPLLGPRIAAVIAQEYPTESEGATTEQ
jgi:uncharacterized protein with HEPN domain